MNFKRPKIARHFTEEELKYRTHSAVHEAKTKGDVDKAYLRMTSYSTSSVDYGYWWIELPGKTEDIIDEYEEIRDELVSCIYGVWDHLKNCGDHGAENYDLECVCMLPGVRESRRLVGDYILNENDDIVALIGASFIESLYSSPVVSLAIIKTTSNSTTYLIIIFKGILFKTFIYIFPAFFTLLQYH